MYQTVRRRSLWPLAALLMLGIGYTAGYLLAPPERAAISRTLPQAPSDVPQPLTPADTPEGAYRTSSAKLI